MKKSNDEFTKGKYVIIASGKENDTEIEQKIKNFIAVRTEMTGHAPSEQEIKKKRKQIKKELNS
jgi:hypothetical protein